jgi:hypothetical protein
MDLVRDVLDKKVVDRNGREMGRVDRLVVEVRDRSAPRVFALEIGPAVLASRVATAFGRWVAGLEHAFGIDAGRPVRLRWSQVLDANEHVKVDLAFSETALATVEQKLRRWVAALPFSS